jgi:putative membrane protein
MSDPRKPRSFRVEPDRPEPVAPPAPRKPQAMTGAALSTVIEPDIDPFANETLQDEVAPVAEPRRRSRLGAVVAGSFGILISLAIGLWTENLIRELFARADWLGWVALLVAIIGCVSLAGFLLREMLALFRLREVEHLRGAARQAIESNDPAEGRKVVAELSALAHHMPSSASGRAALETLEGEVVDGRDLVRLAEIELLVPIDERCRTLVLDAAKRVSIVTAVSPRALIDLAYVLFEAARLVRRIAELYGARPGIMGSLRLARRVLSHLAVTGAIAAGDEFVHQIVGQGLAARLSAKLGEGVVNGMMTARIGLAAMETVRPLPFAPERRPRLADFVAPVTRFAARKQGVEPSRKN